MVPSATPWNAWPSPPIDTYIIDTGMCPEDPQNTTISTCGQVNLDWIPAIIPPATTPNFGQQTRATTNTWLGSIVLHVASIEGGTAKTGIFVNGSCCSVRAGDGVDHRATTTVDPPTTLSLPEPTAPALSLAALAALYAIRRSRRRS